VAAVRAVVGHSILTGKIGQPVTDSCGGGPYELFSGFWPGSAISVGVPCPRSDLDGDCRVDFNDFALLAIDWGAVCDGGVILGRFPLVDVYQDCRVDYKDLAIMAEEWLVFGKHDVGDLGDAPDSTNRFGLPMKAYPGVDANYPTVYKAGSPPYGPIHWYPDVAAYLGDKVPSLEEEADTGFDQDIVNNIDPKNDMSDRDLDPNGVKPPLNLPDCELTKFNYYVTSLFEGRMYVNVWFDWNRDGDWDDTLICLVWVQLDGSGYWAYVDTPEWAVQNQELHFGGPGFYKETTPAFRCSHPTGPGEPIWMRITLSEQKWSPSWGPGGCGPKNGYLYGSTEDYYTKSLIPW
jgi:hypothetical protein